MDYNFPIPALTDSENEIKVQETEESIISEAIEKFFHAYSPKTVRAYKIDMKTWHDFFSHGIIETKPQDILSYIKYLEGRGYQNSTINRKIACLSTVFKILSGMGMISVNPVQVVSATTRIYKTTSPEIQNGLSLHDVEKVIQRARKQTSVIIKFLGTTGLRVSEMVNICKMDLEPKDTEFLSIRIRNAKGGKHRYIYISYQLYAEVKEVFDGDSIYFFASRSGNQLSRNNIYKQVNRAFKKYANRSATPHMLRHFYARQQITVLKRDIKSVSTYLGHSDPGFTLKVYVSSQLRPEEAEILQNV